MTTTANHRSSGNMAPEPEEDIAAIAKQISDHAEAIYQTWKARGLAPNEILTCRRGDASAADKFGSVLTPLQTKQQSAAIPGDTTRELLADPHTNSLERLVNKFVVEDKARVAARQSRSLSPKPFASSIQYALQKFEQKASSPDPVAPTKPSGAVKRYGKSTVTSKSFPDDSTPAVAKTVAASAVVTETDHGTPSWLYRNRRQTTDKENDVSDGVTAVPSPVAAVATVESSKNSKFLDEVAKEEQRLIDALKNGSVVENNSRKIEKPAVPSKEGILRAAGYDAGGRVKPEFLIGLSALSSARRNQHAHRQQEQVPHPELTDHQRANIRSNHQSNPVRPFLTRGSVAERVLIFEKCPTELMKNSSAAAAAATATAQSSWRNIGSDVHGKIQDISLAIRPSLGGELIDEYIMWVLL